MDRGYCFDGLDFQHDNVVHQKVGPKSRRYSQAIVLYVDRHLPVDLMAATDKISGKHKFIGALQEAGPQTSMNPDRGFDDIRGDRIDPVHATPSSAPLRSLREPLFIF